MHFLLVVQDVELLQEPNLEEYEPQSWETLKLGLTISSFNTLILCLRFQANESVQKTISNNIRYTADKDDKALYHKELEEQIRERKEKEAFEKQNNREVAKHLVSLMIIYCSLLYSKGM